MKDPASAIENEPLRLRAVARLGALAPALAAEALESGTVTVEPDVLTWEGSLGIVHGHRVVLALEPALCAAVRGAPAAVDALTAALASAVAEQAGNALAELALEPRAGPPPRTSPYRGRS